MEPKNEVKAVSSNRSESAPLERININPTPGIYEFAAHIYDLDGVITSTEKLHFDGWKETFDKLLAALQESTLLPQGAPEEFNEKLYLDYVDGKPRYDGVRSFIDAFGPGDNCLAAKIADEAQKEPRNRCDNADIAKHTHDIDDYFLGLRLFSLHPDDLRRKAEP